MINSNKMVTSRRKPFVSLILLITLLLIAFLTHVAHSETKTTATTKSFGLNHLTQRMKKFSAQMKSRFSLKKPQSTKLNNNNDEDDDEDDRPRETYSAKMTRSLGYATPLFVLYQAKPFLWERSKELTKHLGQMSKVTHGAKSAVIAKCSSHIERLSHLTHDRVSYVLKHTTLKSASDFAVWISIVHSLYQTTQSLNDILLYESQSGNGMVDLQETKNQILILTGQVIELQSKMIDLVSVDEHLLEEGVIYNRPITDEILVRFNELSLDYSGRSKELEALLSRTQVKINDYLRRTKHDRDHYSQQQSKAMNSMMLSVASSVGTVALAYAFPPVTATYIPTVISTVVAGLNGGLSWVAKNEKDRMTFRIGELEKVYNDVIVSRNHIEQFKNTFEVLKQKKMKALIERKNDTTKQLSESTQNKIPRESSTLPSNTYQWFCDNMTSMIKYSLILLVIFVHMSFMDSSKVSPLFLLKWMVSLCLVCSICMLSVDISTSVSSTKAALTRDRNNRAQVYSSAAQKQYQQECIWYELSTARQLELGAKALFWSALLQDGQRFISTDKEGRLVSDPSCIKLAQSIANEQSSPQKGSSIETDSEIVGIAYSGVAKGLIQPLLDTVVYGVDTLVVNTGFTTKIWILTVTALSILLVLKRILWCF